MTKNTTREKDEGTGRKGREKEGMNRERKNHSSLISSSFSPYLSSLPFLCGRKVGREKDKIKRIRKRRKW